MEEYCTIELTNGQITRVSPEDWDMLAQHRWAAMWSPRTRNYYALRTVDRRKKQRTILMHRLILGEPQGLQVDHKNRDTLDNRRENLRVATCAQNAMNRNMPLPKSGLAGATKGTGSTWLARMKANGKQIYLGSFPTAQGAHAAYCEGVKKYHGEFARME